MALLSVRPRRCWAFVLACDMGGHMSAMRAKRPRLVLRMGLGASVCLLSGALARANEHAILVYQAPIADGDQACPSAEQFAEAVSARLGYDPFVSLPNSTEERSPPQRIIVTIARQGTTYSGQLSFRGERTLTSKDCHELGRSLALAVALRLDPERMANPSSQPSPPATALPLPSSVAVLPTAAPSPAPSATSAAPPPAPGPTQVPVASATSGSIDRDDTDRNRVRSASQYSGLARAHALSAQILGTLGDTPSPTLGLSVGGELGLSQYFFLALDLSTTLPSRVRVRSGGEGAALGNLNRLGLAACAEKGPLSFCTVGAFGLAFVTAEEVAIRKPQFAPYVGLGIRPALNLALSARFGLRIDVEGMVNLVRSDLQVNAVSLFRTWPVSVRLGLGPVWRFP
jgi:hypothetical protein